METVKLELSQNSINTIENMLRECKEIIDKENIVTITRGELEHLEDESFFLDCLRNAGVDNWCGYDEACTEYNDAKNDSDN